MNSEATNVDHKIKVCMATIGAGEKELEPKSSAEIAIRQYLKEHPTAQIKAEATTKENDKRNAEVTEGFEPGE